MHAASAAGDSDEQPGGISVKPQQQPQEQQPHPAEPTQWQVARDLIHQQQEAQAAAAAAAGLAAPPTYDLEKTRQLVQTAMLAAVAGLAFTVATLLKVWWAATAACAWHVLCPALQLAWVDRGLQT